MIDAKTQAELRAKFNPEGSDLRKMQLRMLEMLKYIDRVCQENGIKYWLSSGTCLGAVRHGGFIPWDDDVDIEMLEDDYERLAKALRADTNSWYVLQDCKSDPDYLQVFPKLRDLKSLLQENGNTSKWNQYKGCYIDIFTIEPSKSKFINFLYGQLWNHTVFYCDLIKQEKYRRSLIKFLRKSLKSLFGITRKISRISRAKQYRHILGCGFTKPRFYEDFAEIIRVKFEDAELPIPKGYDNYLRNLYGDYMNLPNVEKIRVHCAKVDLF